MTTATFQHITELLVAWCGGMSMALVICKWAIAKPWKTDAGYALFALAMLILWSLAP